MSVRHATRRPRHRVLRATAMVSVAVVCFGLALGGAGYWKLNSNIHSVDIDSQLGKRPPRATTSGAALPGDPFGGQAVNVLLIGSDARTGANAAMGGTDVEGMRSDTTIIMHVSADRKRAELVSIPRDAMVRIPDCPRSDGTVGQGSGSYRAQFNDAFQRGGANGKVGDAAACTVKTVEEVTGIRIDTFIAVDFTGFISVIDHLKGVEMCIPEEVHDKKAGLDLKAGNQTLNGAQALSYARARYALGDGSDLQRIQRQHALMNAVAQETLTAKLLSNPPVLFQVLNSATASLTTGSQVGNVNTMAGFLMSLKAIPSGNITFYTAPNEEYPYNRMRVQLTEAADELFAKLAADQPVVAATAPAASPGPGENGSADTSGSTGTTEQPGTGAGANGAGETSTPATPDPYGQTKVGGTVCPS